MMFAWKQLKTEKDSGNRQKRYCQFLINDGQTDSTNIFLYFNQKPQMAENNIKWDEQAKREGCQSSSGTDKERIDL